MYSIIVRDIKGIDKWVILYKLVYMFYVVGKWIEIYELGCLGGLGKIVNVLSCKCFDW